MESRELAADSSCDSPWEEERETPVGGGDFFSHMDENGIIGLEEVSVGEELEERLEGGADLPWDPGAPDHEDGPPDNDLLEDQSPGLSELLDSDPLSQSPDHSLYEEDDGRVVMEDWGTEGNEEEDDDGEEGAIHNQQAEKLPERDWQLDMTDEEQEGGDMDTSRRSEPQVLITTGIRDTQQGRDAVSRGSFRGSDSAGENSASPFSGVSSPHEGEDDGKVESEEGFPNKELSPYPHRSRGAVGSMLSCTRALHLSREQLDSEVGIEGETLPESGFTDSLPESQSSRLSRAPPIACPSPEPEVEEFLFLPPPITGWVEEAVGVGEGGVEEKLECNPRPLPLPRKPPSPAPCRKKTPSTHFSGHKAWTPLPEPAPHYSPDPGLRRSSKVPRASTPKSSAGCLDSDLDRRGLVNFPIPDFSKVGPRVRVPRGEGYRPPKSKGPTLVGSGVNERPLVYKSPAEIVREVLMSSGDTPVPRSPLAPPGPSLSSRPQRPIDISVPQEFRTPEQASSLVHQLQEDYNKLLTKYAEAENTIDRLRLEAKVGLYSDPPKPIQSVQSGAIEKSLKVMTLTISQAQQAKFSLDAARSDPVEQFGTSSQGPSSAQTLGPGAGEQLTADLAALAERFQAQLDTFEDLQESQKLKPFELMKGLAGLVQGLDSLERGYLRARDQHRALQLQGRNPPPFDLDREVEGQIFRLGMRLEELRERVELAIQDHPGSPAPPSPPPVLDPLSRHVGAAGPTPHPESPVSPVLGWFGGTVGAEVSSVSGESEGEYSGKMEEPLPAGLPPALLRKHHRVERDYSTLLDHYQSFRELPGLLTEETTEADSTLLQTAPLGHDGIVGLQRTDSEEGRRTVLSIQPKRRQKNTPPPEHTVDHPKGVFSLQEPLPQPFPLPRQQGSVVTLGSRKSCRSSLASLGGSTVSEHPASNKHSQSTTAPSQDGLLSPETDSGFLGSESSQLMPPAGCLPQQGARVSLSEPLGESGEDTRPISGSPASGTAYGPAPRRPSQQERVGVAPFTPEIPWSRQGSAAGHSLTSVHSSKSCSAQPWAGSLSCRSEPESARAHSLSDGDEGQRVHHTRLPKRWPRRRSPSPAMPHHCGDPLRAFESGLMTDRHEAIQSLQAEVARLEERLEDSLRHPNWQNQFRPPPSALEEAGQPHSIHAKSRSSQHWHNGGKEESERVKEAQKRRCPPRPVPRKRSASVPQRRPDLEVTTDSEHAKFVPKAQSSWHIPEVSATHGGQRQPCPESVVQRGPYTKKLYKLTPSVGGEENDNGSQNSRTRACPNCYYGTGKLTSGATTASVRIPRHSRCPLCQGSGWGGATKPGGGSALRGNQPTDSAHTVGGMFFVAAPPPPVQGSVPVVPCVPVCPSVLYVSSPVLKAFPSARQPLYLSLDDSGSSAATRSKGGDSRHARSRSDDNRALSQSLTRTIEAARGVRAASRSVARSLASGLYQQGVLTRSYIH